MRYLVFVLLLAGCSAQIMQSYVGKSVNEAMFDYGTPTNVIEVAKNKRAYQWHMISGRTVGGYQTSTTNGNANASFYGNRATINGTSTTNTYSMPPTSFSTECVYTLHTEKQGEDWIVTGYQTPRKLDCM